MINRALVQSHEDPDSDIDSNSASQISKVKSDSQYNADKIQIDEATNGKEAVETFKAKFESRCANEACPHPIYRLVIMDLNMPVMDGFDASTAILKMRADNPLVFPNN